MGKTSTNKIQYLKGVGPKRAKAFERVGVNTIEDLLYFFPRRYEDRNNFTSISGLKPGSIQTIKATVLAKGARQSFRRRGFSITEVALGDESGEISCVWFNQPYLKDYFKVGTELVVYGKVEEYAGRLQLNSPEFEFVSTDEDASLNIGRIVPVYSLPEAMTQRSLRRLINYCLNEYLPKLGDFLTFDIRSRNNLLNLVKSLRNIHFPESQEVQLEAHRRLVFEEFLLFQILLALRKASKEKKEGVVHMVERGLVKEFIAGLPFRLTKAQEKVIEEIKSDMARPSAMQRLLQGDVGCGKTVVATVAAMRAIEGGFQVAFMVPTEILAKQHYEKIRCQGVKVSRRQGEPLSIGLLIGSLSRKDKAKIYEGIREGEFDLVIGTHSLLEEGVEFKNLGLVVIDEQHKFGVGQRALLPGKGRNPDVLIMTATPIPRTLAITLYGDMDISVINELPPGRLPIKTLGFSQEKRGQAYLIAKEQLLKGQQGYIIYPVIEDSYALDIAGAKKRYEQLKIGEFGDFRVGLLHARLKQKEQDEVMSRFKEKKLDLLVATTVLEVGIDIPDATCMIIEEAERFGLAQLHQLRGRVGRGGLESFCILVSDASSPEARLRLESLIKYSDGFRIAEEDLRLRGPGEFFGRRQHGLAELRIANPLTQTQLLKKAREEAINLIKADPRLELKTNVGLRQELLKRFPEYDRLILVG
jgi:ATP-dependent DNA helicase RecG